MSNPVQVGGEPVSAPTATPRVRWAAVGTVLILAGVAAYMSYGHLRAVAQGQGEDAAALFPISVDGLIVAASLVLLVQRRCGQPGGVLPWAGLLLGVAATIAGNVASAEPSTLARLVAAWPPIAFALSYEYLLTLLRPADPRAVVEPAPAAGPVGGSGEPAPVERETPVPAPPVEVPLAAVEPVDRVVVLGDHPADPGERVPVGDPGGDYAGGAGDQPADPVAELDDLAARTRALIAAAPGRRPGRRALARELGVTEHQARTLLDLVFPNGTSPTDGGGPR